MNLKITDRADHRGMSKIYKTLEKKFLFKKSTHIVYLSHYQLLPEM